MKNIKLFIPVFAVPVIMILFSGCAGIERNIFSESRNESLGQSINWHGVLVAGAYTYEELQIDNWDNAMEGMLTLLLGAGLSKDNIRLHSSKPQNIGQSRGGIVLEPAWKNRIFQSIRSFNLQKKDGLILYISSHGVDNQGLYLESEEDFRNVLSPGDLNAILASLEDVPMIIFISACFSGDFLTGEGSIIDDNRLILTAAAEDRSSFGCGAGNLMPEWDESLLVVLKNVNDDISWEEVIARIEEDITRKEAGFAENKKSLPQNYLPSPFSQGFEDLLRKFSHNMN